MNEHVVFGAGQVGASLARLLAAQGHKVRVVRRKSAAVAPGIEVVAGDARDPAFVARATEGATSIYHCMNPSAYTGDAWETEFPAQGEALVQAALRHDARLVVLDNLYGYGEVAGRRREDTPMNATGRKSKVRVAWDARLRGEAALRYAVGRAGDFFGPGTSDQSLFAPARIAAMGKGGTMWLVGDADAAHSFGYVPDVVAGLAALGTTPGVDREVFLFPAIEVSPRALGQRFATAMGSGTVRALPGWLVRLLGAAVPLFGELRETLYQWEQPFLVDDGKWRARFPTIGTDVDAAVAATVQALGTVN
jgi:nucleoside-diphosphate-sugar epimerase